MPDPTDVYGGGVIVARRRRRGGGLFLFFFITKNAKYFNISRKISFEKANTCNSYL